MRTPHIILTLALVLTGAVGYYLLNDTRGAEPDPMRAGATSTPALAATTTQASNEEVLDVPREVVPADYVQPVPLEEEALKPTALAPRATPTPVTAPNTQSAKATPQNPPRIVPVATSTQPYTPATVTSSFQLKVDEHAAVTVCDEAGRCLGRTFFTFCTEDTPEARAQLTALCGDDCATQADEEEVLEQLCAYPNDVREELPNSSYFKSSMHQLAFTYTPHPTRVYHVKVVALEAEPLGVGTYTQDNDTEVELSSFVFEAQPGGTLTYDIITGADGAVEFRRAQLDYEGDGVVDKELSHKPSAP